MDDFAELLDNGWILYRNIYVDENGNYDLPVTLKSRKRGVVAWLCRKCGIDYGWHTVRRAEVGYSNALRKETNENTRRVE